MLDIDFTFFIQLANFLITLVVLNLLLIRPIRTIISKRKAWMDDSIEQATNFSESATAKLDQYSRELQAARVHAAEKITQYKDQGTAQESEITQQAQTQAQATLRSERSDISQQTQEARSTLQQSVPALAQQAISKVLQ